MNRAEKINAPAYAEWDGVELAQRVACNDISAPEVLDLAYRIIDEFDPLINAFVALEKELAYRHAEDVGHGPLAGVPIAMKDCVGLVRNATRDFGSRLSAGTSVDIDEEVVVRFLRAGLVPTGTTNVPEFSSSVTTESVRHGPCRNPWDTARSTGGSSGGAAAAVAYGAVPIAYGNDAAGSIRVPASCCGLFGFKPSRGRVPTGPEYSEFWFGLMVHHVITRSVRDSALVLDVTEGIDAGAPYGVPDKTGNFVDCVSREPGRLRIAVSDGSRQGHAVSPECRAALEATATLLIDLGHEVVEAAPDYSGEELVDCVTTFLQVSLAQEIPAAATASGRNIGPETVESCNLALMQRGNAVSGVQLANAIDYRNRLGRRLGRFLEDYDVLLTPTLASEPLELGVLDADMSDVDNFLDRLWGYCPFTPLANVAGIPSMSLPLYWSASALPIGTMITGPLASEAMLFSLAGQLERAHPWKDRHPPLSVWNRS